MQIKLGKLNIVPAVDHSELLAPSMAAFINTLSDKDIIGVAEIDPQFSDSVSFCEQYEVSAEFTANCVIIEAVRGENKKYAACVIFSNNRADINGLARRTLDARRASFASMEEAVSKTGMEYGSINPVGLPNDWTILIDSKLIDKDHVVIGGGLRKSKLIVPGKILAKLPNAIVLEGLGK